MFKNYLKTAIRSFQKQKGYTIINVAGLTVGIMSSLFILLWIQDEVNKDKFHEKDSRLYQVMRYMTVDGETLTTTSVPKPLAETLEAEYPEVEHAILMSWEEEFLIQEEEQFSREQGRYIGKAFFESFSYPLLVGDPATVLDDKFSIAISEDMAIKYFGNSWRQRSDVIGTMFKVNNGDLHKLTGVFKNTGSNSSLQFDLLLPMQKFIDESPWVEHWGNNGLRLFVLLREGEIDRANLDDRLIKEINSHDIGYDSRAFLQKFSERYLYSHYDDGVLSGGRIDYVKMFFLVAIFVLVIASINFMNLATARSNLRAKEIGVRKVLGAQRGSLRLQFMIESVMLTALATLLSIGLVQLLLPVFNNLTEKQIIIDYGDPAFWALTGSIAIFTGLLSGSYPALFLSSLRILHVIKGTLKHTRGANLFRKGLVVFQFSLSILLIIGTLTIYRQLNYIMNKNLGLDKENLVSFPVEGNLEKKYESFRNTLLKTPGVLNVTRTDHNPLSVGSNTFGVVWEGKDPEMRVLFNIINADYDWIKTMGVTLVDGRDFSEDFPFDSASFIINEKAAEIMGMENPVGQGLNVWDTQGTIVGLVKDFNMSTMYRQMDPVVLRFDPDNTYSNYIRIGGENVPGTLSKIEETYAQFNPGFPFEYEFLSESYKEDYKSEIIIGTLANYFAGMAIFISCLGLLGLASYTVAQRTKEIGIRKVLGASVPHLVFMLSRDFSLLIIISFVIAAPIAYIYADDWLQQFAFHTNLSEAIFVAAGLGAFIIAALTVGIKSTQASMANPADSLRDE